MSTRPIKTTPAPLTTLSSMSGFTILSTNGWYAMCCGSTPTTLMPRARSRVAICGPTPPTPITSAFFLLGSTSVRGPTLPVLVGPPNHVVRQVRVRAAERERWRGGRFLDPA